MGSSLQTNEGGDQVAHDYPLEELSPRAFEQLTIALALRVLGAGVEAFGTGPDGGREATYTGPVNWSATTGFGSDSWNGYVVLQAKQRQRLGTPAQNATWLRDQISTEFDAWISDTSTRGTAPQYLIFVTNVSLSSVTGSGGIDRINEYIAHRMVEPIAGDRRDSLAARGLRAVKVWHRDQLNGLLSVHDGIRHAFKGLLTVGDLVARLGALNGLLDPAAFQPVLNAHAMTTLATERWVNFREAGGSTREPVDAVVIDLKADGTRDGKLTLLQEVIERGDMVLKRSYEPGPRHLVVTGQPGSGKSTITLFLTQLYRSRFLGDEAVTETAATVQAGTTQAVHRLRIEMPKNHRWPIRVNLAEYADVLGPSGDKTLLRWLSEKVTARAELDIQPHTLKKWIQYWPCLIILDGLDEVTAPEVRPRVLDEIQALVETADQDDADLLIIITTRPTGYTERIIPASFSQLDLTYLDADTALAYGRHVTSRRLADDLDGRDQLIARFERQANDPSMLRLMKTPLQVLIMTLILDALGTLPADRYQLFVRYFDTIYQREQAKTTTLAPLLAAQRRAITDLHEAVGLALQIQSETSSDARALLPKPELRRIAMERLIEVGHQHGPEVERIAEQIVQATTERLVLLVPGEDDSISFEIRSLQELMAARALSSVDDDQLRARLLLAAPSPHWRNTWIFAAGRLFAEGPDHRRDLVLEVIQQVDKYAGWPGWLCPVAPELGAGLLDDGMAAATPKWRDRLIEIALSAVSGPMPPDIKPIALGLSAIARGSALSRIREAIKKGLGGSPVERQVAAHLQDAGTFGAKVQAVWKSPERSTLQTIVTRAPIVELIGPAIVSLAPSVSTRAVLDQLVAELQGFAITDEWNPDLRPIHSPLPVQLPHTLAGLRDGDVSAVLELAFESLGPEHWTATAALGQLLWPALSRVPIGDRLTSPAPSTHHE